MEGMSYQLYHGDCLEVMRGIEKGSIDAIITDLPYGTTACKWDTVIEFAPMWKEVKRVLKPNGAFITTASQPFTSALIMSNPSIFKTEWIWKKNKPSGMFNANKMPMINHEAVIVFYWKQPTFNKILEPRECNEQSKKRLEYKMTGFVGSGTYGKTETIKKKYDKFLRNPTTVKEFLQIPNPKRIHSTQKPVALYEYLIKTYSHEGETVLDIAMGSGTTIEAAERTGRNSIGIEKDEGIFLIANQRLERLQLLEQEERA